MSKAIRKIKLADIAKIAVVLGGGKSLATLKQELGCDCIINGGLYSFSTGKPVGHLKVGGKVLATESWTTWGYAWDGVDIRMEQIPATAANYITCLPLLTPYDGITAKLQYDKSALGGTRGRTALAMTGDSLILYCSGDGTKDATTPEKLRQELYTLGAKTALMLDSGGSSQCDMDGEKITSSRRVHNYVAVWLKKTGEKNDDEKEGESMKKKVCLDPGHGPGCVNGSPDGSYKEREFAWDMYTRLKPLLESQGIEVVVTRAEDTIPALTDRAAVSNKANADLLVSIHSNASGSSGWTSPSGLMVYTSAAGEKAGRNVAANAILARMRESGVGIHGTTGLAHELFTVLTKATAPAVLIEYGFHTDKEDVELLKDSGYRDKLAVATAKGICDYFSIEYTEKAVVKEEKLRETVQKRFALSDETMDYLEAYKFGAALLTKLAAGK